MKHIFIAVFLMATLTSCFGGGDGSNNSDTANGVNVEQSGAMQQNTAETGNQESSGSVTKVEIEPEVINELVDVTKKNFDPLFKGLQLIGKEDIGKIDCKAYFYLPEADKRPKFQLDVQAEYIQKCEDLKK